MQTFLPHPNFQQSAATLDRQRLGKQRVEILQILKALATGTGWVNHPATKMWAGHEHTLIEYGEAICIEWKNRGYKDTCHEKILAYRTAFPPSQPPHWLGNPDFHASHRSNLLAKNPDHYNINGWTEPHNLPYIWPTP